MSVLLFGVSHRSAPVSVLEQLSTDEADATVRDVVYLGAHTRYLLELDGGGDLTVVEQNLATTSEEVLAAKGRRVRALWAPAFNHRIDISPPADAAEAEAVGISPQHSTTKGE